MVISPDKEIEHLVKIVKALKAHPGGLWIRELARQSDMHMESARRIIKQYPQLFQEYADFTAYRINLKIIRLKRPDMSLAEMEKFLQLSRELKEKEKKPISE